ncbi:MAG TPA: acetyl-CoA carboxylase biotin carboxylase subunit [Euzebyales bacterium]|nr:acetyl-CoA carboxylase biotin carboxylase subunit [Euzebyales bacterium]
MPEATAPLRSVLVANRGEIALRVFRACRDLGIRAVGVYSEIDRGAPWLRLADDAFLLGPAAPLESYLHVERVLSVADRAGVDAIHPGYGFLSENAAFARAVEAAGLRWVGPPPDAIVQMGDKLSARAVALQAGVPVVPGTDQPTDDPGEVRAFAARHGYPIAIKAAFGGGGRGLRVVDGPAALDEALGAAQREAHAAFGRGEVYVERYLQRPRHIEAQVLADAHGTCLFLGERDCSTQRRHQKLIEEAPAPGVEPAVRDALGAAAVAVSQKVGYVGAGTVEFLYEDGRFHFLEMNTRLQVEHPVTEMVTGVDLVHWQLRIAGGEALPWRQDDIAVRGHAIEVRINAEQPANRFAPATGVVTGWRPPEGPGVRLDAGVAAGYEIPPTYDSLLAKLIAHGADRDHARRVLIRACAEFEITGVPTTLSFHRMALEHPDFVAGTVSTVSVEQEWDLSGLPADAPADAGEGALGPSRAYTVEVDGRMVDVKVFDRPGGTMPSRGRTRRYRRTGVLGPASDADLRSPMQGTVVKVAVEVGATVVTGDLVLVLEAMKMENHVAAHRDGVLTAIHAEPGAVVHQGEALFTIEPA